MYMDAQKQQYLCDVRRLPYKKRSPFQIYIYISKVVYPKIVIIPFPNKTAT